MPLGLVGLPLPRPSATLSTPRSNPPVAPSLPTPARYTPPANPAPYVYTPQPTVRQWSDPGYHEAQNPARVTTPKATTTPTKTVNQLKEEAVRAQQASQIANQQAALAQAAAIVYGNAGGGGGYGGGGYGYSSYGGGYGGGYGGYTGGYSSGGGYGGGGGGGGGTTVTVGGLPVGDVTSPVSGWAARYLPAMIPDVLANPGTIGRDTIKDLGIGGEPLQGRFGELSTYVASQLLPILYAGTPMGSIPKGGDVVNRLNEILKKMATPGGSEIDPMKLLDTVLSEGAKSTTDKQTLGSALFAGMSPAKQAETMQGLVNNISNWLANPYFAQAMRNWASTQKDNYISASASATNTNKDPFAKYLRGTALPG